LPPDISAPETTITAGPSGLNSNVDVSFEFTGSDDGTAALDLEFECALDGAPFESCASPYTIQDLTAGEHTFYVRAIDEALNVDATPAERTWTLVDLLAPETSLDSTPEELTTSTVATFTFSSDEPDATFECALNGADYTACTSPAFYSGLTVGLHNFSVRALDPAANADATPENYSWTIILPTAPATQIVVGPPALSVSAEAFFTFASDQPNVIFECALDGSAFTECETPFEIQELTDGLHETHAALFAQAPAANLLHLACHGRFRSDNPLFSSLQLADGWLTVRDTYNLKLQCDLVTLSACETGVSQVAPGDELIGLARGFFAAGAPTLLVSLWAVDDEATTQLMTLFYQRLLAGVGPAAAL